MAKTSSGQNIAGQVTKQPLHGIKNGSIKKDKKSKFKNTPAGKVTLVDNAKAKNKNITSQKNFQKNTNVKNNQNSPKEKLKQLEGKENSSKRKQNSPKGKQNIPKGKRAPNELQNKQSSKKNNLTLKKVLEEVDDSDSDDDSINEEEISFGDETFEDEEENDTNVPDIFGASLAENSDLDDEDFEEEEEDEESEDEESEDEEEDEDVNISGEQEMVRSKDIQSSFNSESSELYKDDIYDDDDEEDDDDDNDDDNESYEDMDMNEVDTSVSQSDDEEDEDENEDEDESEASCLKALLGKSMTDDDDDEDFNEEDEDDEDDDISDEEDDDDDDEEDDSTVKVVQEKAIKNKVTKTSNSKNASEKDDQAQEKALSPEEQQEINKRTIFITNVPKETKEATLKKVFGQYGLINNMRFRGIIPSNLKTSKKVAAIKKDIHPEVHTLIVYINYKSEESAKKALCMNGKKFEGNYLNVTIVAKSEQKEYDNKKAVFIGNLKFGMDTNLIWELFNKCGEIDSIRIMRDKKTGQTKGYGYVNFKSEDAVVLALKLDGTEVNNRPIRIKPIKVHDHKEKQQKRNRRGWKNKSSPLNKSDDNRSSKKFKNNSQQAVARSIGDEVKVKQKKPQRDNMSPEGKIAKSFQGQKSDVKDKKKGNKFNKKKKELAGKLTAKPKKQRS